MSDYPYSKLVFDFIKNGVFILGDNILLLLLIYSFIYPKILFVFPIIFIMILFISIFMNCHLVMKYPLKQFPINICLILIKFHIPILNLYLLYKSIHNGKTNWEKLNYESNR